MRSTERSCRRRVSDQVGDRADLELVLRCERLEVGAPRHRAVVVHDLDDDGGRVEAREPREVTAGLGVSGPGQHATGLRHHRKYVPGLAQVLGTRIGLHRRDHRVRAVVRRDAGGDAFRRFDGQREVGAMLAVRLADHQRQAQLAAALRGQREADEAAAETRHEVDVGGGDLLRGHHEVAFVLAILIVHDDDHAAGRDVGEDFFDAVERFQDVSPGLDERRST
jgi:hypothetical protein